MSPEDHKKISQCSSIIPNRVDNYPEGLRILAVDDNPVCLKLLTSLLKKCGYQFTVTTDTAGAYNILKKNRNSYDLVLTDVKNNMDGCKFAQLIDLEMDIPVIIMSADDGKESIMNCVKHGARGYLLKPVRYEELKIIWQHVARKNYYRIEKTVPDKTETNPNEVPVGHMDVTNDRESEIKAQLIKEKKKLDPKKPRFSWKKEIHTKFENVVAQLGVENAVPKKILELMNEPNLTRENVASHLQKFRKNWDRKKEKAKRLTSECEKAIKSIHCSSALPNYSVNQCIAGQHYQNSSMEQIVTDTNLHSFGAKLRATSSNNLLDGMPQNHLRFSSLGGQMTCTIKNNPVNDISVTSSHSGQCFGPRHEVDGMRFDSYSRSVKTENNHFGEYSCPSGGYNHSRVPPSLAHLTNSSFMLPPNSTSFGMVPSCLRYLPDRNHSTQMVQPINSSPMLPSSSSYGQIYMANSTYSTEVAQPNNYQPMPAQSFSFGSQLERGNSFDFKGREENESLSREPSLDSNKWNNFTCDQTLLHSDIGTDLSIVDMGDELVDMVSQFDENSAPSL